MARYNHGVSGKWTQCADPPYRNMIACCGCGMTHRYEFKIVPATRGKHLTLWMRCFLDKRATAQIRKRNAKLQQLHASKLFYIAVYPRKGKYAPWSLIVDDISGLADELKQAARIKKLAARKRRRRRK